ncbi:MAG TPA: type II secretion system F family protein [Candidatus Limnocylindria bacterium]|nr:type II secretion system F family protein [Candidatus Limnocylindria bacterium]
MFLVFSILIFLAVVVASVGLVAHRGGEGARVLQARLRTIARKARDLPRTGVERDTRYSAIPMLDTVLRHLNLGQRLELLLYRAGMTMRVGALVLLIASFAIGGYFLGVLVTHRVVPALLFMALAAPLPYFFVVYRKHARMRAFASEFPDALDLLVSALRAGLSFSAAMQIVAEESPEPVRGEFAVTVEEQALGLDFRDSLINLTKRVDSLDLRFFATAIILQRETGGNLAEILENTAKLIRDRFRILGDIQTFTAQGRLTGLILVCLPTGVGLFTFAMAPEYFRPMVETETGRMFLWSAAGMQLAGMLAIRKIVNIKV